MTLPRNSELRCFYERKAPILSELTKTLEDEQMRLSNENRGITNYACSLKPKKAKSNEQKSKKERVDKRLDNRGENKK